MGSWAHACPFDSVLTQISCCPSVPGVAIAKVELRKVWLAMCSIIYNALHHKHGIIIPQLGTFTLCQTEASPAKVSPWSTPRTHQLAFVLDPSFEITYHMAATEVSHHTNKSRMLFSVPCSKLTSACLEVKTGLPRPLITVILREIIHFIGEGVFKGGAFVIEFQKIGRLYIKRSQCRMVFDQQLIEGIVQDDAARNQVSTRKQFKSGVSPVKECLTDVPEAFICTPLAPPPAATPVTPNPAPTTTVESAPKKKEVVVTNLAATTSTPAAAPAPTRSYSPPARPPARQAQRRSRSVDIVVAPTATSGELQQQSGVRLRGRTPQPTTSHSVVLMSAPASAVPPFRLGCPRSGFLFEEFQARPDQKLRRMRQSEVLRKLQNQSKTKITRSSGTVVDTAIQTEPSSGPSTAHAALKAKPFEIHVDDVGSMVAAIRSAEKPTISIVPASALPTHTTTAPVSTIPAPPVNTDLPVGLAKAINTAAVGARHALVSATNSTNVVPSASATQLTAQRPTTPPKQRAEAKQDAWATPPGTPPTAKKSPAARKTDVSQNDDDEEDELDKNILVLPAYRETERLAIRRKERAQAIEKENLQRAEEVKRRLQEQRRLERERILAQLSENAQRAERQAAISLQEARKEKAELAAVWRQQMDDKAKKEEAQKAKEKKEAAELAAVDV